MSKSYEKIKALIEEKSFVKATFSGKRNKSLEYNKVSVAPVYVKNEELLHFEYFYDKKATHQNLSKKEATEKMSLFIDQEFKQALIKGTSVEYQVLVSKKGSQKIIEKQADNEKNTHHNRQKDYILKEGEPVDFLVELGVMNKEGQVYNSKYNKFKQINKFLELFAASVNREEKTEIRVIDFGCGKSYLTFAMYYYLKEVLELNPKIQGLDLKEDVIDFCNKRSKKLGYEGLQFTCKDIKDYSTDEPVDLVISLHACDNATDIAIEKAVRWGAKTILAVPCCQHEFFDKIQSKPLKAMLKHGIIKERISALATDALRASLLEVLGYEVKVMEFIDLEYTPKNIMIRAIKRHNKDNQQPKEELKSLKAIFGIETTFIEEILKDKLQ